MSGVKTAGHIRVYGKGYSRFVPRLATGNAERLAQLVTALLLMVGVWLRARGYLYATIPLWLDEFFWAVRLFELPLKEHLIRPLGFMAASKVVTSIFSRSEAGLRFIPWAAGMAALFLTPALGKRLFNSAGARLLLVAVIALQPAAIDLSKEFKPYSLGFFLHLSLVWLVLRYVSSGKTSDLVRACLVASPAVLFTQDIIFAYPSVFLILGWKALRGRRVRHVVIVALTSVTALALIAALYFFIWRQVDTKSEAPYWGTRYDVFFVPGMTPGLSHARWIFNRYFDISALPGQRIDRWSTAGLHLKSLAKLKRLDQYVWFALHLVGLVTIVVRKRFAAGLLLFTPILVLTVFNFLGKFPMGSFRADFFLLAYIAPIAGFALERKPGGARYWDPLPVLSVLVLPLLVFERDWHENKYYFAWFTNMPRIFGQVLEAQTRSTNAASPMGTLALDSRSCAGWRYYSKYQPEFSKREAPQLLQHLSPFCVDEEKEDTMPRQVAAMVRAIKENPAPGAHSWFVLMGDKSTYQRALRSIPREFAAGQTFNVRGRQFAIEAVRKP